MLEATSITNPPYSTFDDLTILYVRFLRLIAILPYNGRYHTWVASRLLVAYWFISGMIDLSMIGLYLVNGAGGKTVDAILETVLVLGMNARFYLLLWHRQKLADLLAECRAIWDEFCDAEDNRRWVRHFEGKARRLFQALLGSCALNHVMYSTFAVGLTLAAARQANDTHGAKHFLPYKFIKEGGEDTWPDYKFNFGLQWVVIANTCIILATADSTAPVFIMIGAGNFRALRERLNRAYEMAMSNEDDTSQADVELANCCRLHQRIFNYCGSIDGITRTVFLTQLMCTGYNLSRIMIKLISTDPDRYKYLALALLNVGQLFVCQWAPDHLLDEMLKSAVSFFTVLRNFNL